MAGFVVTNGDATQEAVIKNNGFFPDIEPANFRAATRQDKTVTPERVREALIQAIAAVNRELDAWQISWELEGKATLAAVPAKQVNEQSVLIHHYLRAVYSLAKAELIERYNDFDATNTGQQRAQELTGEEDTYRRDARWAIADLQGKARTVVELI